MPTEKGPLTREGLIKDLAPNLAAFVTRLIAAERALAAEEMRERSAQVGFNGGCWCDGTLNAHGDHADHCPYGIGDRIHSLSIPDADLRGLLEYAIETGVRYKLALMLHAAGQGPEPSRPTFESVWCEYIERSRAK